MKKPGHIDNPFEQSATAPWHVDSFGNHVHDSHNRVVALVQRDWFENGYQKRPDGEVEANARLIAAAPELLCVLTHLVYQAKTYSDLTEDVEGAEIVKQAEQAINKAKGKK